jgi:O-antigen ligase
VALAIGILISAVFLFLATFTFFAYSPTGSKIPLLSGEISSSHRAQAWSTSIETFLENPIAGRGVGEPVARALFTDPSGYPQKLTDAHNTYISVLAETGIVGFLAYFSIIGFVTIGLLRQAPLNNRQNAMKFCLLIALADAFFYQSLTGSYEDARHLWVLFGLAAATVQRNFESQDPANEI